jgi:hypothetical protein
MAQTNQDNQPDDSAIDRARNKETAQKKEINWSGLGKDVLNFLLKLIIIFLIGSRVVFACKVAQANILPTDEKCMPYENNIPNIQPIQINIFETFTEPALSKKISSEFKNPIKLKRLPTPFNVLESFVAVGPSSISLVTG